jgi:hypothetical protein
MAITFGHGALCTSQMRALPASAFACMHMDTWTHASPSPPAAQMSQLGTREVIASIHGISNLGIRHHADVLLLRLHQTGFGHFSTDSSTWAVVNFFWACGQLKLTPEPKTINEALAAVLLASHSLEPQTPHPRAERTSYVLSTVILGLANMRFYPGRKFLDRWMKQVVCP